jgi:hypothetical protein
MRRRTGRGRADGGQPADRETDSRETDGRETDGRETDGRENREEAGMAGGYLATGEVVARLAGASAPYTSFFHPDPSGLPGSATLERLTNGLGWWALVFALVGMLVGAAAWALGAHTQNYHQSYSGRRAVLISGLAALLIGAAPALIQFFFSAGSRVH